MDRPEILRWLRETDPQQFEVLWQQADDVRRRAVGDAVHLRGLVEISNHCARACCYCGLRAPNRRLPRYRMTADEIVGSAHRAVALGYGTIVLQSGEDFGATTDWVTALIRRIRSETPLAITLSLGERGADELRAWRDAGADRYLLRFETSNPALFARIHPPLGERKCDRLALLAQLRALDYEVGSGVMIGIPGQTWDDLADDIETFRRLDLDMIGVGPFLPHPDTPLGLAADAPSPDQVPNTELTTYKVIALARLVCPRANIPSTTALATLNRAAGRELGLARGANVIMPNLTPPEYRRLYETYPDKACLYEAPEQFDADLQRRITALGRSVGRGPGMSPNYLFRHAQAVAAGARYTHV